MKISTFLTAFLLIVTTSLLAQDKSALKAGIIANNAELAAQSFPKIAVNDNRCRYESLILGTDENGRSVITFRFATPCDAKEEVQLTFHSLNDAISVKTLVLNNKDYDRFNIVVDKTAPPRYEVIYRNSGR